MKLISCNSNLLLAKSIASHLATTLVPINITHFLDGELFVEIEDTVRGEDVFVIQSTSSPANDNIMELLITLDALKRASAGRVTAVMPYFGYARQDRKNGPRTPITAKLLANIITQAGADRVLTLDLHAGQIQGFFDIPVDNLYASPVFINDIKQRFKADKPLIISPDAGGVVRAGIVAKKLDTDLAIVDKRRCRANESEVVNIIGDVANRDCIIIDDIVDSAGTLCNAAEALVAKGAKSVYGYVSHGVLSGEAKQKIANSKLNQLVITDSIKQEKLEKISQLTIAPLIAEAIKNINEETSISSLFE